MNRVGFHPGRIARALAAYEIFRARVEHLPSNNRYKGAFYADDVEQLLELTRELEPGNKIMVLFKALQAGWWMGYQSARHERSDVALAEIVHAATAEVLSPAGPAAQENAGHDCVCGLPPAAEYAKAGKYTGGVGTAQ